MTWPTCGSVTPKTFTISGISPIEENSLVPMAKPPKVSAARISAR